MNKVSAHGGAIAVIGSGDFRRDGLREFRYAITSGASGGNVLLAFRGSRKAITTEYRGAQKDRPR